MDAQARGRPEFDFTARQRAVIDRAEAALLVAAGPGTGKTRVIVERIARLVERGAARPQAVLALTFARRAAGEMQVRLATRLGHLAGPVTVGTFHSFCLNLIQRHHRALGYATPPRVIGHRDQIAQVRRVVAKLPPDELGPLAAVAQRPFGAALIVEGIGRLTEAPEGAFDPEVHGALEAVAAAYHRQRRRAGLLDHASMVPEAVRLLESDSRLVRELQDRFRFILVDEYQDTNRPQERLLDLLARPGANLMVVGDDDQAIYAFRGTSPRNLLAFEDRRAAWRLDLSDNWRCGAVVQGAATRLIGHNRTRLPKAITPVGEGGRVTALRYADLAAHARGLAGLIDDEARLHGRRCGDIAVLWRSLNHPLVDLLLAELQRLEIPARVIRPEPGSGGLRDAVAAVFRMRIDGKRLADEPLATVLESELSSLSPLHAQRLVRSARRARQPLAQFLEEGRASDEDARSAAQTAQHVREVLGSPANRADALLFEIWWAFPSLREAVRAMDGSDVGRQTEARRLVAHFQALFEDAQAFVLANPEAGPEPFLERLELEAQDPPELRLEEIGEDLVRLMTVHQAKGLEWPVVLVPALEDGYFPAAAGARGVSGALEGLARPDTAERAVEEERRLFYVAMTRAQQRLVMSVDAEGRQQPVVESRFFVECGIEPEDARPAHGLAALRSPAEAETALRSRLRLGSSPERAQAAYALARLPRDGPPIWWSLVEPTTVEPPELGEAELEVSATGLTDYRACPYRFKAARLLGLRGPVDAARGLGTIVHEALSRFHDPAGEHEFDETALAGLIGACWDEEQFRYRPIAKRCRQDARGFIANYLRHHGSRGRALAVEQEFEMPVGGLRVRGRIDAIFGMDDGVEIVDFKTGRSQPTKAQAAADLQLGIYGLGFDLAPQLQGFGSPRSAVYVFLLKTGPRADGARARDTAPEDRAAVRAKLERYETDIRRWKLPAKSRAVPARSPADADDLDEITQTRLCRHCEFRRICPDFAAGRQGA